MYYDVESTDSISMWLYGIKLEVNCQWSIHTKYIHTMYIHMYQLLRPELSSNALPRSLVHHYRAIQYLWYLWYWEDQLLLIIGSGAVRRQVDRRLGIIFTHAWQTRLLLAYFSLSVLPTSVIWPIVLMQSPGTSRTQFPYPEHLDHQTSPERPSGSGSADTSMASQQSGRSSSASSRSQSSKNQVSLWLPVNRLHSDG